MGKAPRGILPLLVGLILAYTLLPGESWSEEGSPREKDHPLALDQQKGGQKSEERGKRERRRRLFRKRRKEGLPQKAVSRREPSVEEMKRLTQLVSPYATTEEVLLPHEAVTLRRQFTPTEARYFGGREVEEQAVFESLARQDEERFYYAIKELEKPWWRDLIESFSGVVNYRQGFYTNYFNNRARDRLWTEKPFFGARAARWSTLSVDANYFVSLERLSFTNELPLHPHILQTHGGQARFFYRPSRRFNLLVFGDGRKSNKIATSDERVNQVTIGNNVVSHRLGTQFRYFVTTRDVVDFTFDYDYSRVRDAGNLRISRGYRPKIAFLKALSRRLVVRGFWLYDYVMSSNSGVKTATTREEPGGGFTFALGRSLTLDVDYSKQFVRAKRSSKIGRGSKVDIRLNHRLTRRFTHSSIFGFSQLESKRSAISKIDTDPTISQITKSNFESLIMAYRFSYLLTKLTSLNVTMDYMRTRAKGSKPNHRSKILVELIRPIFGKRANLTLSYAFDRNNGAIAATYVSHEVLLGISTTLGAGRKEQ